MKIKDYAASRGCTAQNVYLHLKKPEFDGHWSKGTLDQEAIEMLDELISPGGNGVVVMDKEQQDQLNLLRTEVDRLRLKLESQQDENMRLQDLLLIRTEMIGQLQIENKTMSLQIEAQEQAKKPWWRRK